MTRICVVSDARFERDRGAYWDPRNNFPRGHWEELLTVFDEVEIYARARDASGEPSGFVLPAGTRVLEAPYAVGPGGIALLLPRLFLSVWRLTKRDSVFLLRGPGFLSMLAALALVLRRKPYTVELLGDSGESLKFSGARFKHVWSFLARVFTRSVVRHAASVLYVVGFLEERYPPSKGARRAVISDARLFDWMFRDPQPRNKPELTLAMLANMEQPYKGHDHLLRAIGLLRDRNVPVRLRLIGDGRMRPQFEALAHELGITDRVEFHGALPWGAQVFDLLDDSDLFILTSLTEGMPKALLEAMARGLPAIATKVGGMPEVLPADAVFPAADAKAIADKVEALHRDRAQLAELAGLCRSAAEAFREQQIGVRRRAFYTQLREAPGAG